MNVGQHLEGVNKELHFVDVKVMHVCWRPEVV